GGFGQRREHADEGRLPRAVRSEQGDDATFLGNEVEAVERAHLAVLLDEVVGFDDGCHGMLLELGQASGSSGGCHEKSSSVRKLRHGARPWSSPASMSFTSRPTNSSSARASASTYSTSSSNKRGRPASRPAFCTPCICASCTSSFAMRSLSTSAATSGGSTG